MNQKHSTALQLLAVKVRRQRNLKISERRPQRRCVVVLHFFCHWLLHFRRRGRFEWEYSLTELTLVEHLHAFIGIATYWHSSEPRVNYLTRFLPFQFSLQLKFCVNTQCSQEPLGRCESTLRSGHDRSSKKPNTFV